MSKKQRILTEGSIVRNIWYLALPMMIGNVLQNLFSIVDMKFVGKVSPAVEVSAKILEEYRKSAIAAVSMSGIVLGILFVVIIGIYMGTTAMVARFIGAKKQSEAENVAMQSLFLGVFCYAIIVFIGYPLASLVLRALGATDDVIIHGAPYIKIMFLGSFTMILGVVLGSVLRAAGDAITPLITLILSTLINIGLDPCLIFGWWKFPRMGVAGSALATVIARGVGAIVLLWIFLRGNAVIKLRLRNAKMDFSTMWRIAKIGIFASVQGIMRSTFGVVLMPIVAAYSTSAVAAYGICMRLRMVVMMPAFGLATAVSTLVGQNLGANEPERAEKSAWITAAFGFAIMTFFASLYIIFSRNVISFFSTHPEIVEVGTNYMHIVAGTFGFIGLSIIIGRALSGAGDTLSPMIITAIGFIGVRISLVLLLSAKMGLPGVWYGIAASIIIQGLIISFWFNTGRWKSKQV